MSNYGFCLKRPVKQQLSGAPHRECVCVCVFAVRARALPAIFSRNCVSFHSAERQTGGERARQARQGVGSERSDGWLVGW